MNKITYYKVGGTVRDELMGVIPKDLDLVAIGGNFSDMCIDIENKGGKIFLKQEPFLTIRCLFPNVGPCDVRLARKDGAYGDGRRPDEVFIADSLLEDSLTRDFTINAMYKNLETGEIIDYHDGKKDLENKLIRCVGDTKERFKEDYLRVLRAARFSLTKGMFLSSDIKRYLDDKSIVDGLQSVSAERIREEVHKCFKHDSAVAVFFFSFYGLLANEVFNERTGIWLKPTMEAK